MYESFYGFSEKPFTLLPDPSFLYLGEKHSIAFSMLEYGFLNRAGFTVITGDVGSGKTTLIRHLLNQMPDDVTVGLVSNTHQDMGQLLQWVLLAFGQEYREREPVVLYDTFTRFLIDQYAHNKCVVLIIDESQNLKQHVLEELRMLSNINVDKSQVLQLVLVGQPQLRELLKDPELLQFRQRVSVDYHLTALSEDETRAYIVHRIRTAGCQSELFTKDACSLIYQASKGIPRLINILCDTALVHGYADQELRIGSTLVKAMIKEKSDSSLILTDEPKAEDRKSTSFNQEQKAGNLKEAEFSIDVTKMLVGNPHNNS